MSIHSQLLPDKNIPLKCQRDLTLLALLVWGEARGESDEGKSAVAHVVMNRWRRQGFYGNTIRDVIVKPWQFSCFNDSDPNTGKLLQVKNNDAWNRCAQAALDAYLGLSDDPTGGAVLYCRFDCDPDWKKDSQFIKQIGNHYFYKEKE